MDTMRACGCWMLHECKIHRDFKAWTPRADRSDPARSPRELAPFRQGRESELGPSLERDE